MMVVVVGDKNLRAISSNRLRQFFHHQRPRKILVGCRVHLHRAVVIVAGAPDSFCGRAGGSRGQGVGVTLRGVRAPETSPENEFYP